MSVLRPAALLFVTVVAAAAGPSVVELTGLPSSCELRHGGTAGIESSCALHVNGVDVVARLTALQTELAALELGQSGMEKTVKAQEASLSDHGDELDALEKESKAFLKTHTDTAAAFNTDLSLLNAHINAGFLGTTLICTRFFVNPKSGPTHARMQQCTKNRSTQRLLASGNVRISRGCHRLLLLA